jgi:hypothetical protein
MDRVDCPEVSGQKRQQPCDQSDQDASRRENHDLLVTTDAGLVNLERECEGFAEFA